MSKVVVKCSRCGIDFKKYPSQVGKNNYCSRQCVSNKIKTNCKQCDKRIEIKNCDYKGDRKHYCSVACKNEFQKTLTGNKNHFYGKRHTEETKKMISNAKTGVVTGKRVEWEKVLCATCGKEKEIIPFLYKRSENHFCNVECHGIWKSKNNLGENNPNYNLSKTEEERARNRNYKEYYEFLREALLVRDECQKCGSQENLCVHHKNAYHWCVERRTDVTNSAILCETCHRDFHSKYSYLNNTEEQFEEYLRDMPIPC